MQEPPDELEPISGNAPCNWLVVEVGIGAPVVVYGGQMVDPHQDAKPEKGHSSSAVTSLQG